MKLRFSRTIWILFGISIVLVLFMSSVFAQSQSQPPGSSPPPKKELQTITPPTGKQQPGLAPKAGIKQPVTSKSFMAQIKPEIVKINKLPDIPFKPLIYSDFKDPQTGQILKPDQIVTLRHLKSQKQIRGDQFISAINHLEKDYNTYGHSHRDHREAVIGELVIRKDLLKTQANRIMSKTKKFGPSKVPQPLDAQTFRRIHSENMGQAQVRSNELKQAFRTTSSPSASRQPAGKAVMKEAAPPSLKAPEFKPFHQEGHWNESYGDPDLYAIHQDINMVLDGQKERLSVTANNELGITIFNTKFTVVGGKANLSAPGPDAKDSSVQGEFSVKVLGRVINVVNITTTSNQPYSGYVPIIEVPETVVNIPLPTPIKVGIGYSGTIGINYDISVTPLAINCQIVPVAWDLYQITNLSYAIGIPYLWDIYEVGYEGRFHFLSDRPTLIGQLSVKPIAVPSPTGKPIAVQPGEVRAPGANYIFEGRATCFDNFTALRGKFYITFKVDLIFWEKKWKFLVYDDDGFQHVDYLFDDTLTRRVFI